MGDFDKKVALIEIEVDNKAAQKEVDSLTSSIIAQKDAVKANTDEIKTLEKTNKDLQKQVTDGTKTQKQANKEIAENKKRSFEIKKVNESVKDGIKDLNKERQSAVKVTKLQSNSLDSLRKKSVDLKKELNAQGTATASGRKKFEELTSALAKNNEQITKLDQAANDYKTTVGQYKNEMGKATEGTDALTGGMASAGKGFLKMAKSALVFLATPIGAVLGLLAFSIMAVKTAFESSEEGQNKFNKLMAVIDVTIGNLMDLLADFGEAIISVFEDPQQAIKDFSNLIKQNIINRFEGMLELIPQLGKAITLLFDGEFSAAGEVAANAVAKVALGIDDVVGKTKEATAAVTALFDATVKESKLAAQVADDRAKADLLARDLLVDRAKIESDIAALRLKSRQEDQFGADERKQALLDAQTLQDTLLAREQEVFKLRSDAITMENTFSRSNKENLDAEAQAKAALLNVETKRLDQQRTTQRELNRLNKEIEADDTRSAKAKEKTESDLNSRLAELHEGRRVRANEVRLSGAADLEESLAIRREIENENFALELEQLENQKVVLAENKDISDEEKFIAQQETDLEIENLKAQHAKNILDIAADQAKKEINIDKKKGNDLKKGQAALSKVTGSAFDAAQQGIENRFADRFANLEKELASGAITQEQFDQKSASLEKAKQTTLAKQNRKSFLVNKLSSIGEIGINTTKAVIKAVAASPLTGGLPWSGLVTAQGVAAAGVVAAKRPPAIPSFAQGGDVFGGVIKGKSHSQGGEDIHVGGKLVANMQGDEGLFVTKREATNPALQLLNQANLDHGGASLFSGTSRFLQEGGAVGAASDSITAEGLATALGSLPVPMVEVKSIMAGINADNEAEAVGVI